MTTNPGRLPWEIVETLPSTDAELLARWDAAVDAEDGPAGVVHARVGRALASYWATQLEVIDQSWSTVAERRRDDVARAIDVARTAGAPDVMATALLGRLYAQWGPDDRAARDDLVRELTELLPDVVDTELRLRTLEWRVLDEFDRGDLDGAAREIEGFSDEAAATEMVLFHRRELLWRGNLAMLRGHLDEALQINQEVISATATVAGSPFSFQNVAITHAIERFLRRGLVDVVESVRSIRASSPRVDVNYDVGLAFTLSEIGELDEARELVLRVAPDRFAAIPRDLNWLITIQLLGLVALTLDEREHGEVILDLLRPFVGLDATHGSGYASYGPVARVAGSLAARWGDPSDAEHWFDQVLTTRPAGPWTSLTRLDRARASLGPDRGLGGASAAATELRSFDMGDWADVADGVVVERQLAGEGVPIARLESGVWTLRHPTGRASVNDGVGMQHLVRLLASAGAAIDVAELSAVGDPAATEASSTSTLDREAQDAYRRRIAELEAADTDDADVRHELSFLRRELAGAAHHTSTSAELERTRVRVTKALRRAIDAIADGSTGLGQHLRGTVDTGRRCIYRPADGVSWSVVRAPD